MRSFESLGSPVRGSGFVGVSHPERKQESHLNRSSYESQFTKLSLDSQFEEVLSNLKFRFWTTLWTRSQRSTLDSIKSRQLSWLAKSIYRLINRIKSVWSNLFDKVSSRRNFHDESFIAQTNCRSREWTAFDLGESSRFDLLKSIHSIDSRVAESLFLEEHRRPSESIWNQVLI